MAYQIRMKDEDTRAKAFECRDACHRARVQMPELTGGREWESPFGEGKSGERGTPFGGSLLPPSLSLSLCLSARSCATLSPSLCLLCSSARVRSYGLTLAGRSSVCQFKVVAFITVGGI